ncbi:MAG: hypothetical protein RLN62_04190 [Rickettsiales bacterium]
MYGTRNFNHLPARFKCCCESICFALAVTFISIISLAAIACIGYAIYQETQQDSPDSSSGNHNSTSSLRGLNQQDISGDLTDTPLEEISI